MLPDLGQRSLCWDLNGLLRDEANNRDGGRGGTWSAAVCSECKNFTPGSIRRSESLIDKDVFLTTAP